MRLVDVFQPNPHGWAINLFGVFLTVVHSQIRDLLILYLFLSVYEGDFETPLMHCLFPPAPSRSPIAIFYVLTTQLTAVFRSPVFSLKEPLDARLDGKSPQSA